MLRFGVGALAMLLITAVVWGQDKEPEKKDEAQPPASLSERYEQLVEEFGQARTEFMVKYRAAKTDEEKQKMVQELYPRPEKFADRFQEIVDENPEDPAALQALTWLVSNVAHLPAGNEAATALLELAAKNPEDATVFESLVMIATRTRGVPAAKAAKFLVDNHIDNEKLGLVCLQMMYSRSPETEALLRKVMEQSSVESVQGQACYALAKSILGSGQDDTKDAEKLFETVIEKYADINPGRRTLGQMAEGDLFELRNLQIGLVAPEIEGEDVDGERFKLTDYRGKVVVLDFWGDW